MKEQSYIKGILVKIHKNTVKKQSIQHTEQPAKFSQVAKIRNLRNLASCENFVTLQNSYYSALLPHFSSNFLLICTCSFEFGSGSSYLNRHEEYGVIGMQNYKISTKYDQ